jgi:hypothetical protein
LRNAAHVEGFSVLKQKIQVQFSSPGVGKTFEINFQKQSLSQDYAILGSTPFSDLFRTHPNRMVPLSVQLL